jgi:hypothetical protein
MPNLLLRGSEVFTAVVMKSIIFWDVTPCSLLRCMSPAYLLVLAEIFFDPEDGGDMFL